MTTEVLRVSDLRTDIHADRRDLPIVNGVSFHIGGGEMFGLVGESGCGKTTLALTLVRLVNPVSGSILFRGLDLAALSQRQMKQQRRHIQIVFQDPYSSLPSRLPVTNIVGEPLDIFSIGTRKERRTAVSEMLDAVGLSRLRSGRRFTHELSGGERQRVSIARALITRPELVILDEPVSSLDVSIQAQVLSLLQHLQSEFKAAYLLISHDLRIVAQMCDRVAVMYAGKIVELAESDKLYSAPLHPYTQALLSSIPTLDVQQPMIPHGLPGQPPSGYERITGCVFNTRCPIRTDICFKYEPALIAHRVAHHAACHNIASRPERGGEVVRT